MFNIKDKYAVVTGASGGIGGELVRVLATKYGARVIGTGRREKNLAFLKEQLGDRFEYCAFDVREADEWKKFADDLETKGIRVSLLVNCAGAFPVFCKGAETKKEVFSDIIDVNFISVVNAVNTFLPIMRKSNESSAIYNVCSSAALCPVAGTAAYSASKGAVKCYSETLSLENYGNVRIGVVYPGATMSDLFRNDARTGSSGIEKVAAPASKTAARIAKAIVHKKRRAVIGFDAKIMNFMAKVMPIKGPRLIAFVMKKAKVEIFSDVFEK